MEHPSGKAYGGTAIIIRNSIKHHPHSNTEYEYLQATTITVETTNGEIQISAIYSPPKHKLTMEQYENYFNNLGNKFIAAGDYNAKHWQWGSNRSSPRAKSDLARSSSRARAAKVTRTKESEEQSQAHLAVAAERQASLRAAETSEQTQARLILDAERHASLRAAETSEQTQARQILDAERHASLRATETSQETRARHILDAERHAFLRATETSEQTQARLILDAERHASLRAAETSEQTQARQILDAERHASLRAAETFQQTQARQIFDVERPASLIAAETHEASQRRRVLIAERQSERRLWPEIVDELMPEQSAIDRHDIVARVFRLKVKKLMTVITKGKIFVKVLCFMYSIEWQKRGLPHVHILLWFKDKLRPDQIDKIISAEIPNLSSDKALHDIILKNMIHEPCGPEHPQCPCMKDGKCTKKFPQLANPVDEVQTYQSGRYVSSNEARWRLLGFPLHERHPAVTHLNVHLENGERVYFTENNFRERVSAPPKTTLTAFFELCTRDDFAKTLLYVEVPRYYTWNATREDWKRQVQGTPVQNWPGVKSGHALGRIYTVHVSNMECFCLRMLLHHVRGPTLFKDLKKHNNQEFSTFREACEAKGLLENDNHWDVTLEEAAQCRSAAKVRDLFATLIATCGLLNPQQLWEKYKNDMTDDILHTLQETNPNVTHNDFIYNEALTKIEDQVITITGKVTPHRTGEVSNYLIRELDYDTASLQQQITEFVPRLNSEQRLIFDDIVQKIESGDGGLFFLDAPGGTGKTFLLNLLLAQIRKDKGVAVAVASSGIAATLLNGGRTAHSVLKLPLNLAHEEMPVCNISKNSEYGRMLQQCKLLVWDECTMSHKRAIEAVNHTMKDIKGNQSIRGGMVVLLAGDLRQILPVITWGTPADEINACLKASTLWVHVQKFSLTTNMRVQLHNDTQSGQYAGALLKIGEDRLATDSNGLITLNCEFCNVVHNTEDLENNVYPDLQTNMGNREWLCERAILVLSVECHMWKVTLWSISR
ncbi:uncharacterized protein LOC114882103 [Osmia bicornis bicornis]|uniref:uncharacterized protein LOC114882103 n=1 Tax=Osmia bicornis bicornis TaxID=1437191 RepID=UPI001EAEFD32|nr:uncharacterized protein LOC114882103 [Osmia bicornis bicornis]